MNLIIDVGNTLVKFAVYQQDVLIERKTVKADNTRKTFHTILKKHQAIEKAIISSVGRLQISVYEEIKSKMDVIILRNDSHLPFKNLYKTPQTLGVDRIALVSAAVRLYPKTNVLIIDAGTCITYDFINTKSEYLGGAISPGIRLRYSSLHTLTANLPLLDTELPRHIIGDTTANAIHSGVVFGILKEIDGCIDAYQQEYVDLTVILTGGDADFLSKQLKNSIFANSNFLLDGLNFILESNSH